VIVLKHGKTLAISTNRISPQSSEWSGPIVSAMAPALPSQLRGFTPPADETAHARILITGDAP